MSYIFSLHFHFSKPKNPVKTPKMNSFSEVFHNPQKQKTSKNKSYPQKAKTKENKQKLKNPIFTL